MSEKIAKSLGGYIESRLEEWGRWARDDGIAKLWYSSTSNVGRIVETGGAAYLPQPGAHKEADHPEAEEIEKCVNFFKIGHPWEASAIFCYYVDRSSTDKIAKDHKCAPRTIRDRLKYARIWLEGRLASDK